MFNKVQPPRPEYDNENAQWLSYATMPPKGRATCPRLWSYDAMRVQLRLYRAARSGELQSGMAIADIHEWLFGDTEITKTTMGSIVCLATLYNPRVLKGKTKTNPSPKVMYVWRNMDELIYGLEWMICTWLPRFVRDAGALECGDYSTPEDIAAALDELASLGDQEYLDIEAEELSEFEVENAGSEPRWSERGADYSERVSPNVRRAPVKERGPRPKPLI